MIVDEDYVFNLLSFIDFKAVTMNNCFSQDNFADYFTRDLPEDCEYSYGASKLVIIPDNTDYVIKVPFNCVYNEDYIDPDYAASQGIEYDEDEQEEWLYFQNAYYCRQEEYGWDYCEAEVEYYEEAADWGVEKYFAETRYIGDCHGWPIYVQPKCEAMENSRGSHSHTREEYDSIQEKADSVDQHGIRDRDFLCDLFKNADVDIVSLLFQFIDEMLNDLHSGNYGYFEGTTDACLLDYAGWNEV